MSKILKFEDCIKILKTFKYHNIDAFISGGWLRDNLNNIIPKDLDIFINNSELIYDIMSCFDKTEYKSYPETYSNHLYSNMREDVISVIKYEELNLDFIIMKNTTCEGVVSNFDTSICQIYAKLSDDEKTLDVFVSNEFLEYIKNRIIYLYTNIDTSEDHINRIKSKFFNATFIEKEFGGVEFIKYITMYDDFKFKK